MKKSTLENLCNYLNGDTSVDVATLRDEVTAEYDRVTAKSRENSKLYRAAHDALFASANWNGAMTAKDIADACADELPEGFTASKIQYAFRALWSDEIEKHENGKNPLTYSKK